MIDCALIYSIKVMDAFMLLSKCGFKFLSFSDGDLDCVSIIVFKCNSAQLYLVVHIYIVFPK